jgi:polyisoprenoid-binding protein YceI
MATLTALPTGRYALDTVHSSIGFGVKAHGLASFRSSFARYDAEVKDGTLVGSADVASISVDEPDFKGHLLAADFFDADAAPTITFRSKDVTIGDDGAAEVDGDLTIRGITKPVVARGTIASGADPFGNERLAFSLSTVVDRRDFGMTWQKELPSGGDAVSWDVEITVDLQFVKQA